MGIGKTACFANPKTWSYNTKWGHYHIWRHGHIKRTIIRTRLALWYMTKSVFSTKNWVVTPFQLLKLEIATVFFVPFCWEGSHSLRKGEKVSFMDAWLFQVHIRGFIGLCMSYRLKGQASNALGKHQRIHKKCRVFLQPGWKYEA